MPLTYFQPPLYTTILLPEQFEQNAIVPCDTFDIPVKAEQLVPPRTRLGVPLGNVKVLEIVIVLAETFPEILAFAPVRSPEAVTEEKRTTALLLIFCGSERIIFPEVAVLTVILEDSITPADGPPEEFPIRTLPAERVTLVNASVPEANKTLFALKELFPVPPRLTGSMPVTSFVAARLTLPPAIEEPFTFNIFPPEELIELTPVPPFVIGNTPEISVVPWLIFTVPVPMNVE